MFDTLADVAFGVALVLPGFLVVQLSERRRPSRPPGGDLELVLRGLVYALLIQAAAALSTWLPHLAHEVNSGNVRDHFTALAVYGIVVCVAVPTPWEGAMSGERGITRSVSTTAAGCGSCSEIRATRARGRYSENTAVAPGHRRARPNRTSTCKRCGPPTTTGRSRRRICSVAVLGACGSTQTRSPGSRCWPRIPSRR